MSSLRIVIIGGGSVGWVPNVVRDMLLTDSLRNSTFVLYDIDRAAADLTAAFCRKLAGMVGAKAKFIATDQMARAFRGADYFVITISTGGLDAMAHDLAIPEAFGIYHTVGDTSGPGGWARFIRSFDAFVKIADGINRYAPHAVVLNYTNPLTTLTMTLSRLCKGPVVGLCHGLFENIEYLVKRYRLKREDDLALQYGGLNHFFWTTKAQAGEVDVLADLTQKLTRRNFHPAPRSKGARRSGKPLELAGELFRATGVMPYLGNRHTCEFFSWVITSKTTLRRYNIPRTTAAERKQGLRHGRRRLRDMVKGDIPDAYLSRTRETAADIIDAHSQHRVFIDVGNVPNVGQISNLPYGLVVETAVRVDRNGFTPITFGPLPDIVHGFVEPYAHVFAMVVDACFDNNLDKALQALRLDPTCSHLNTDQVNTLGRRLLRPHRRHISAF